GTWLSTSTNGELDTGATAPSVGDVIVLEAAGGSPRVSLGRVVDVDGLLLETEFAPGENYAAGTAVYRVEDAVIFPVAPAPSAAGPSSRRATEGDAPMTNAYSGRIGAAGAWERAMGFAPLPLVTARD